MIYEDTNGVSRTCETDAQKADVLNKFFTSVFNQNTDYNITDDLEVNLTYHMPPIVITKEDIMKRLSKLNVTKSAGSDKLHPRVLKEIATNIAYPLKIIFTQSLSFEFLPYD